jgi:hypothetical protein
MEENPQTRRVYKGCYPCDLLPSPDRLQYPMALIANLDKHVGKGTHWIAMYAQSRGKEVIYFDSLSLPINNIIFDTFLCEFPKIIQNKKPYQSPLSNVCAHYCIVLIYYLSQGYSFDYILHLFENHVNTDEFVKIFVNKLIK